jgi:hypothetical protein
VLVTLAAVLLAVLAVYRAYRKSKSGALDERRADAPEIAPGKFPPIK